MMPPVDSDWLIVVPEKRTWNAPKVRVVSGIDR